LLIGGANISRQLDSLKKKPPILVGSPGRILELAAMGKLSLHYVKKIILDEGDRLLDADFMDNIRKIMKGTQRDRQLMYFSASLSPVSRERAASLMKDPELADTRQKTVPSAIRHYYIECERRDKHESLRKLLHISGLGRALIFVNSPFHINAVYEKLSYHGVKCAKIFGETDKEGRRLAVSAFAEGRVRFLVASDIAARGMDFPDVTHVINFDFPENAENYLHRAGRTGRNGSGGVCLSLVNTTERPRVDKFARELSVVIEAKTFRYGKLW
jgi:superfamily II DNA/RNA helicase